MQVFLSGRSMYFCAQLQTGPLGESEHECWHPPLPTAHVAAKNNQSATITKQPISKQPISNNQQTTNQQQSTNTMASSTFQVVKLFYSQMMILFATVIHSIIFCILKLKDMFGFLVFSLELFRLQNTTT